MKRLVVVLLLFAGWGCASLGSQSSKDFEKRITKLEREVNRLRTEVAQAHGEVTAASRKVKALEENYSILMKEVEKLKKR